MPDHYCRDCGRVDYCCVCDGDARDADAEMDFLFGEAMDREARQEARRGESFEAFRDLQRRRLQGVADDSRQGIADLACWNDRHPAERPIDAEPFILQLDWSRRALAAVDAWREGDLLTLPVAPVVEFVDAGGDQ